jgi:Mce-associated membrane protein
MTARTANLPEVSMEVAETVPADTDSPSTDDGDGNPENTLGTADARAVVVDAEAGDAETPETREADGEPSEARGKRRIRWGRMLVYGVLPALVLMLAMGAGYLKWLDSSARESRLATAESVRAATESMVALLSYKPDTVERDLGAARDRLTGEFKNSYTGLIHDVVIPGSTQKQISALANVPAAASVSASPNHAVVLVFVNQTVTVGNDPPTNTASSVRVTLDKIGGRWLISQFDPV